MAEDQGKATDSGADEPVPEVADATSTGPADVAQDTADSPLVTEAERIAAKVASERPVRKAGAEGKGRATPKQARATATDEHKRVGPITFVKQSIEELKKVNWPTLDTWQQYFIVVLVFVVIIIAFVGLLDLGFGAALLKIFGNA